MRGHLRAVIFATFIVPASIAFLAAAKPKARAAPSASLLEKAHAQRTSASDLEIGGEGAGLQSDSTRYFTREDLLSLPQVNYTVIDDANFRGSTEISGVLLEELLHGLAATPDSDLVVAICSDQYHTNYPRAYLAAHHPLLVLKVNGQPPERWPKNAEGHSQDMGPYLISHAKFTPSFKILAHADEPQIPWGVVRLEFRNEATVFGAIAPRRSGADPTVQAGYQIAKQNCFRCHNMGSEGGHKARRPWLVLSALAEGSPEYFASYIRNPKGENPNAQMPSSPSYDDMTLRALTAYFRTFSSQEKP